MYSSYIKEAKHSKSLLSLSLSLSSCFIQSIMAIALLLSLLVSLLASASASEELWNIDCGATESHTIPTLNMTWIGDEGFVRTGESHRIRLTDAAVPQRMKTLRSFPAGVKNCYTIPTGENRKVHVKADFLYGNYDGLAKPPSFTLIFDAHSICSVTTDMEPYYGYCSWTYVTRSSNISICFGRDADDQVPFVSALQVAILDDGVYPQFNSSTVLFESSRTAFGTNSTIRYPYDKYDRFWGPSSSDTEGYNYTMLSSNATGTVNTSSCVDDPPAKLFSNAASTLDEAVANLTILTVPLPSREVPVYFNMYFSEVSNLTGTRQKRSFHIYVDDSLITTTKPVEPPFGGAMEVSAVVSASNATRINLVPAANSTLPPIISGLELLKMDQIDSNGTYSQDVQGLSVLQNKFEALKNWSGDPCRPIGYNWEWLNCTDAEPPRVIRLSLGGYGLSGRLPDFSDLDALQIIDLHNNSLYGTIPDFLGYLPDLRKLNLADNNFSSIPPSLSRKTSILNITGNPLLDPLFGKGSESPGTTPQPPPNGSNKITAPLFVLYLLCSTWAVIA